MLDKVISLPPSGSLSPSRRFDFLLSSQLALVKEAYDLDPSARKCLGTDAVTMIFGADRTVYIRGTRVSKIYKGPVAGSDNVRKEKYKNEFLEAQLDMLIDRNTILEYMIISLIALISSEFTTYGVLVKKPHSLPCMSNCQLKFIQSFCGIGIGPLAHSYLWHHKLDKFQKYKSQGMGTCVDDILITSVTGYWSPSKNIDVWSLILRNLRKRLAASIYVDGEKL
ncbi:hypothetical protein C5167_004235 [Papaver somniferum]|nr:hypothetical protein C5167_004235 [Papaver somniferum]